jgi:hypothetical protein
MVDEDRYVCKKKKKSIIEFIKNLSFKTKNYRRCIKVYRILLFII